MTRRNDNLTELDRLARDAARMNVSRRGVLLGAAGIGAGLLVGCSSSDSGSSGTPSVGVSALPGGTPVTGGTLTAGMLTLGSEENLWPGTFIPNPDVARGFALYNFLFYPNEGEKLYPLEPGLALSAEADPTATQWTFKLRDQVVWHDGKPFTADDVVYNISHLWNDPNKNYSASFLAGLVDFKGVKAVDKLTVHIPLLTPSAEFPSIFAWFNFAVLQEGATVESTSKHPIGTGPFKFQSFTPGQKSVFIRNENYWEGDGKPYVDTLVIDSSFNDNNALLNAILSGEINILVGPQLQQATQQLKSQQVQVLQSPSASNTFAFGMRVDEGEFVDNRIRQGMKLMTNRQALIDGALGGFGTPGNDLQGPNTPYFADDLVAEFDPDKAKDLFTQAGVLGKTFTLPVANAIAGMVESAQIWAEQAKAAGITIDLKTLQPGDYFTTAGGAYTRPFCIQVAQALPSLTGQYRSLIQDGAPYWDTHWGAQTDGGAQATELILKAEATLDEGKAEDLWHQVQQQQADEGGYVVWADTPYLDFAAKNIRGLSASSALPLNNFRFQDGWIAS